jgi:alkanesulfonate monooxygenase SsuD/methylene tetrahydromethanopterin reductase-like flavin-dependent oxidoreductase (luciferase family)
MPEYYGTVYDPLQTLMFVAANTTSIRLGTSVVDALFHTPVMLGRQLATLDHFSGGRLDVGIGQGWSVDEFVTSNVPFTRRGAGFEEFLTALQAVWGPDPVSFEGRFYTIPESSIGPKPVQPGGPPLLVGALQTGTVAVERAGRLGLGLHPMPFEWDQFEEQLRVYRDNFPPGRPPARIVLRSVHPVTEASIEEDGRVPLSGSIDQVARDLRRVADLSVDEVMWDLNMAGVPLDAQLRLMEPLIGVKPV